MNKIKKSIYMLGVLSALTFSGCGNNNQVNIDPEYSQDQNEIPEIKKIFEPGTHIVEIRFDEEFPESGEKVGYVGVPIEIPDGYELYDFDTGYWETNSLRHIRSVYVFINTKTVEAFGRYESKYDTNVFPEFGTVVEDLELKLK